MRDRNEAILMAADKEKNQRLWDLHKQLNDDVVFFKAKLQQLLWAINQLSAQALDENELTQDFNTLSKYVSTLEKYLLSIQYSTKLGLIKINKMSAQDMLVLEAQAVGVRKMRDWVTNEMPAPVVDRRARRAPIPAPAADGRAYRASSPEPQAIQPDQLSALIDEAKTMDYNVSTARVWMRRAGFVLGSLIAAAAAITLVAVLMTPAGSISAAVLLGLKVALPAFLGFLGVIHPVTTTTNINMGIFNVPVTTPVPSTIGMLGAGMAGLFSLRKSGILNPQREEDARNTQAATVNQLTDSLRKKINAVDGHHAEVKNFLLDVVDYADKLFNEGVSSWTHETQKSKMQKARLILRETAKIIEDQIPNDIHALLSTPINGSRYTFSDLLNSQRNNVSTLWKTSSGFFSAIAGKYAALKRHVTNTIAFDTIHAAI